MAQEFLFPATPPGGAKPFWEILEAGEIIPAYTNCYRAADGKMYKCDNTDVEKVVPYAMNEIPLALGASGKFYIRGAILNNPAWTWIGHNLYVGLNGEIVDIPPVAGYIINLGWGKDTQIEYDPDRTPVPAGIGSITEPKQDIVTITAAMADPIDPEYRKVRLSFPPVANGIENVSDESGLGINEGEHYTFTPGDDWIDLLYDPIVGETIKVSYEHI